MEIRQNLKEEDISSIKKSFFYVYHNFLIEPEISKKIVSCLFKWSVQLNVNEDDLLLYIDKAEQFHDPKDKVEIITHLFNLVYMIYLDSVVEDIELDVLSEYAERVGMKPHIVNDILKTIVTAPDDGVDISDVRARIEEIILSYES